MAHSASPLFKPAHPRQPVATLMLIENSQSMSFIWTDLRDQYLGRLVDGVAAANPSVPASDVASMTRIPLLPLCLFR